MKNKVSEGSTILYTAQSDISAGDYIALGANFGGIAIDDAKTGEVCVLDTSGVFVLPKHSTVVTTPFAQGAPVQNDNGKVKLVTGVSTVAHLQSVIGYVAEASNSASTTAKIKLI